MLSWAMAKYITLFRPRTE